MTESTIRSVKTKYPSPLSELTFFVPELKGRPVVGGGCCALPVEYLMIETLGEVEGVREISITDGEAVVRVWVAESDSELIQELKDRIEGLGYRVMASLSPMS